jgi:uncharacterized protein
MEYENFPSEVKDRLGWYVYRLIDPRNGETFYVGKGKGDRVFQHARGALKAGEIGDGDNVEDAKDLKIQQIKEIDAAELQVGHVIHRYGIDSEDVAYQIEGALIDAYPGLKNQVGGRGSGDFGVRHVHQIIAEYSAQPFDTRERLILISIAKTYFDPTKDLYDAVRGCWVINPTRAGEYKLVLAHLRGLVVGAFRPQGDWLPATRANFPWLTEDEPRRWGFVGVPADEQTRQYYVQKRVPDRYRKKGAASPIRFIEPSPAVRDESEAVSGAAT